MKAKTVIENNKRTPLGGVKLMVLLKDQNSGVMYWDNVYDVPLPSKVYESRFVDNKESKFKYISGNINNRLIDDYGFTPEVAG